MNKIDAIYRRWYMKLIIIVNIIIGCIIDIIVNI